MGRTIHTCTRHVSVQIRTVCKLLCTRSRGRKILTTSYILPSLKYTCMHSMSNVCKAICLVSRAHSPPHTHTQHTHTQAKIKILAALLTQLLLLFETKAARPDCKQCTSYPLVSSQKNPDHFEPKSSVKLTHTRKFSHKPQTPENPSNMHCALCVLIKWLITIFASL